MAIVVASATEPVSLFSARKICELALRKVGAFTINDDSPDPAALAVALDFLEMEIANLAGGERLQWLVPATVEFALTADIESYVLETIAGSAFPSLGLAFPIEAYIVDADDNATPVDIVRRKDYEDITDKTASGTPDRIYIDRLANEDKNLFVYPVPADSTLSLRLVAQTYPRTVLKPLSDQAGAGEVTHGFDRTWQMWMILATAYQIGDGPVRQIKADKLDRIGKDRDKCLATLTEKQNRERISARLHRTKRYGG